MLSSELTFKYLLVFPLDSQICRNSIKIDEETEREMDAQHSGAQNYSEIRMDYSVIHYWMAWQKSEVIQGRSLAKVTALHDGKQ